MADISESEMEKMINEMDAGESAPPAPPEPPKRAPLKVGNEVALNRFVDHEKVQKDLSINPNDLDNEMIQHAALYVYYAELTVKARRQFDRLKQAFEILEARLDAEYRESLSGGAKKPTEASIRNALVADARWSGAQAKVIEAGSIFRACEAVESGMSMKKDMILEVARDRRKDKEGQLRVLESQEMRESVLGMLAKNKAA